MEELYSVKVKTKPDTRNLYPSERRYSASTVSGLAWVHIALAATSFLLACLALVNPNASSDIKRLKLNETQEKNIDRNEFLYNLTVDDDDLAVVANLTDEGTSKVVNYSTILVLAPSLLTIFALAAGVASIMASVRWYIDRNITWLFAMSILATLFSLVAFIMITVWFVYTSEGNDDITEFYKDTVPFKDVLVLKHADVIHRNESHLVVALNSEKEEAPHARLFTKRVLSINILIAAFLEFLWSLLSVKISYKGMRSNYKDDGVDKRGNCIAVVTTIKGNNSKKLPRNVKLLPPKPDLLEHYPSKSIKRIYLGNGDNHFYIKNEENNEKNTKQNTDTSSEFYKERMMNFLNRCASMDGISNPERSPSVTESTLNVIPEGISVEISKQDKDNQDFSENNAVTQVSWGDTPDCTIYNQNTLNLDEVFKFCGKMQKDVAKESEVKNAVQNCSD